MDNINTGTEYSDAENSATKERAIALYNYLRELSALKTKVVTNVLDYPWKLYLKDLKADPDNIVINYRDRTDEEIEDRDPVLIRVHKPEFKSCPVPPSTLEKWLVPGWDDPHQEVETINEIIINQALGIAETFSSNQARTDAFYEWLGDRSAWQKKQLAAEKTRDIFNGLYQTYVDVNRESESMEVVVANGTFMDKLNNTINHPLVTRRVSISFDSRENTLCIEDVDVETELYTVLLQTITEVQHDAISAISAELKEKDYHPLDRVELPEFLKSLIHKLSSESVFSPDGIPENWTDANRFLLYCNPVFIFRKRLDGTQRFIQEVVDNITDTGWVPLPIGETVSGGKIEVREEQHEHTIEEQLAAVGGEDVDILLAKEANREQLEIAQRINMYNAVLVQGPPGTGKTHTIANLLGHFLAKGESVLVTSQTPKALQVLKDKVPDNIKPLCVSVLNDSNQDMEKSVDEITAYMSRYTANELWKKAEVLKLDREKAIQDLAQVRKKLYEIINSEANSIVINGEEVSPSKAAEFVCENEDELSYIPGKIKLYTPLPLSYQDLIDLYRSNDSLTAEQEKELSFGLPSPDQLADANAFAQMVQNYNSTSERFTKLSRDTGWSISFQKAKGTIIDQGDGSINIPVSEKNELEGVMQYVDSFGVMEEWMKYAAVDGYKGGAYAKRWETLIAQIEKTSAYSESLVSEVFGKEIKYKDMDAVVAAESDFGKLHELFERKGKVSKLDFFTNKGLQKALDLVTINGNAISSKEDSGLIVRQIQLQKLRKECAAYWSDLLKKNGAPDFFELDQDEPENVAKGWITEIRTGLNWHKAVFSGLADKLESVGIRTADFIRVNKSDNALQMTEKILSVILNDIPNVLKACKTSREMYEITEELANYRQILRADKRAGSAVCSRLVQAIDDLDIEEYEKWYKELADLYDRYSLQSSRKVFLDRLSAVAPEWAEAIRNRIGIHGESVAPTNIEDAWKWKQYSGIISEMLSTPYDELQAESLRLGRLYRSLTGQYAEKMAWYHLLKRTENDIDMRQALNGWKLTVRKIGKGTGKNAPRYKAQARALMSKCQNAVPAWIMPMTRVVESLNPKDNRFDVIIVDEASQSDVTSLGVLYLAKKVIIVGDDKQVSPMAIGSDMERMNALESMYIKNKIPNSHLYGANTSLYDIAATTYQPLMLREHFRCVPDIIGFSNMLSYDYKIKPLRDAGSTKLLPSVVNYRVSGERVSKHNLEEAKHIVALIKACIQQPEYKGKTFGVISLLGDEQARLISSLLYKYVGPQEVDKRKIIAGNPAHFQGDERDIIFLSLVDSRRDDGLLAKMEFGPQEAYRKRYNVAASRAKDQLWVVDSLDSANDLKPGDIRKSLIEYSMDPTAFERVKNEVETKADSPFEASVASALILKGYSITQQWKVGAYRLDMVVTSGNKHVAIECDGERFHSGEAKIREDMERQTILERSGWQFVRIRGSEYYRRPTETMNRVMQELHSLGIEPELQYDISEQNHSELLERIKQEAFEIAESFDEKDTPSQSVLRSAYRDD